MAAEAAASQKGGGMAASSSPDGRAGALEWISSSKANAPGSVGALDGAPPALPAEMTVKAGNLLKQGAANKAFQERFFELIRVGDAGEHGAFLVYYESELRQTVKGYISLDGACVSEVEHEVEPYCMLLTTPARRLSLVTPSAESRMNVLQKLDNWGRQALRSAMASGGNPEAPHTSWTLAAPTELDKSAWLDAFAAVSILDIVRPTVNDTAAPTVASSGALTAAPNATLPPAPCSGCTDTIHPYATDNPPPCQHSGCTDSYAPILADSRLPTRAPMVPQC